jgi:hypothetical protein
MRFGVHSQVHCLLVTFDSGAKFEVSAPEALLPKSSGGSACLLGLSRVEMLPLKGALSSVYTRRCFAMRA